MEHRALIVFDTVLLILHATFESEFSVLEHDNKNYRKTNYFYNHKHPTIDLRILGYDSHVGEFGLPVLQH